MDVKDKGHFLGCETEERGPLRTTEVQYFLSETEWGFYKVSKEYIKDHDCLGSGTGTCLNWLWHLHTVGDTQYTEVIL